jgi:hypothetical protein
VTPPIWRWHSASIITPSPASTLSRAAAAIPRTSADASHAGRSELPRSRSTSADPGIQADSGLVAAHVLKGPLGLAGEGKLRNSAQRANHTVNRQRSAMRMPLAILAVARAGRGSICCYLPMPVRHRRMLRSWIAESGNVAAFPPNNPMATRVESC